MSVLLDAAGRRRAPVTMPGYHAGRPPGNKGMRYPADPPTVDEIVAVMRHTSCNRHGLRIRAMVVVLWRAGLRVREALALAEHDLDQRRGSLLVRFGKGGRRREPGMDEWGWEQLRRCLAARAELPPGPIVLRDRRPHARTVVVGGGGPLGVRRLALRAGVRRRFAPHQLPHAHALELAREGVPLNIIQRQLGHLNLGTTSIYRLTSDAIQNLSVEGSYAALTAETGSGVTGVGASVPRVEPGQHGATAGAADEPDRPVHYRDGIDPLHAELCAGDLVGARVDPQGTPGVGGGR
jgi:integrase